MAGERPEPAENLLLAELIERQGLLVGSNVIAAGLFATGIAGAAPARLVAGWLLLMALTQGLRLAFWLRARRGPPSRRASAWLAASAFAGGAGWGAAGLLFTGLGSPAQEMLVPFFLAGMTAGAVISLAGYPPALYAYLAPALLPYAAHLAVSDELAARTMAATALAYGAGLVITGSRVHRARRRLLELNAENQRLIGALEEAQHGLEHALARRGAELATVMDTVPVAVWLAHDPQGRRITGNARAVQMLRVPPDTDFSLADVTHRGHFQVLRGEDRAEPHDLPLMRAVAGDTVEGQELRLVFEDGAVRDMLISAAPVRDPEGRPTGAVSAAVDITERKRSEEQIKHLAHHDALTGLPNRILLQERLRQGLATVRRGGVGIGVLLLDLDNFKDLNDTLGHPAGDRLLRAAADRLAAAVRPADTLARLGGDEFAVVQPGVPEAESAAALARRLIETLADPFALDGQEAHLSASVGVAVSLAGEEHEDELIRRADVALYRAKHEGRCRFRIFEPQMDTEVRARRRLERELAAALEQGAFELHYQPQLDLRSERIESVEALIRWRHPERGLVLPDQFIPAAEASGFIRPLGAWVLREACREIARWREAGAALSVAVNLSPAQLRNDEILRALDAALEGGRFDPGWLELEITESLLVEGPGSATERTLRGIAARGVRLALDDFGTGCSSLAALKRLPVSKIKVDQSFVRDIGRDRDDEALVRAIVSFGHMLGKQVVAEGVESEQQLDFLRAVGCDAVQGYLVARPAPAPRIGALLPA